MNRLLILTVILLSSACSEPDGASNVRSPDAWTPQPAGTLVAADSMQVIEDKLNNAVFAVELRVADGNSGNATDAFKYDVHVRYGEAEADGDIVMPFGGENLRPLLRRGEGYSYIMGFIPGKAYGNDTAFHEYYKIAVVNDYIRIIALKGFVMQ